MSEPAILFSHGIGHCKDVWTPIINHIHETIPGAVECASFSFPFHGERADPKVKPAVVSGDPDTPRLPHPAVGDQELLVGTIMTEVRRLRASNAACPIIGVGHSMGAIALWITEITHPGTFARLVLFESIYNFTGPMQQAATSFLVAATLKRRSSWSSRAAAFANLSNSRGFSRWHP